MLFLVDNHLGDIPGLNFPELALRRICSVTHFSGLPNGSFLLAQFSSHRNSEKLQCRGSLKRFTRLVTELKGILERFMNAVSSIDQCFISDETMGQFPKSSPAVVRPASSR